MFPDKRKRALHRLRLHKKPALVFQATSDPVVEMRRPTIAQPEQHDDVVAEGDVGGTLKFYNCKRGITASTFTPTDERREAAASEATAVLLVQRRAIARTEKDDQREAREGAACSVKQAAS